MPGPLGGKVALVTGAASGIGRATALAFAQEGAKVVVSARSIDQGEETVACIRSSGGDATFVRADVTIASEVAGLVQTAVDTYGRLDCAHNNAGVSGTGFLPHKYPDDLWDRNIGVNLTGVWLCLKYEVRQMLRQGSGAIVNTSSVGGADRSAAECWLLSKQARSNWTDQERGPRICAERHPGECGLSGLRSYADAGGNYGPATGVRSSRGRY
jgi:NAD(P)-dependent dehydrogenase (short-subunit alcohol dehydrogenase family)